MTFQEKGLSRNTIDKYYTIQSIVSHVVEMAKTHLNINKLNDLIIEPSAGNGSFLQSLKNICNNCIFLDILPEHPDIKNQDYLQFQVPNNLHSGKIHIVGNPPFGRQSSLAIKFIKHSSKFANSISFILPKSFKKESMSRHFPINFHLILELDIPDNSFIVNGETHNVQCVFQIWEKRNENRKLVERETPINFKFVKKNEPHDISFRRVGVYAGKVDTDTTNKSEQSHYFIKLDKEITEDLLIELNNIDYKNKNDTVGPRSISKNELIREFNLVIV